MIDGNLQELLAIARAVGWGAGDVLLATQQSDLKVQDLADGPVTIADGAANDYILSNLHASLGTEDFGYLTEETYKLQPASDRLEKAFVWIIDPLDGTKEYIQKTGEFAVHIALVHDHRPVLAVVACPAAGRLYFAAFGSGTFVEHKDGTIAPVRVSQRSQFDQLIVVTSRSHRSDRFNQLMQQFPCQTQKSVGSLGGKIAAIVDQQADVYLSLSGSSAPKDWDLAAPELILTEAGGKFTHFDGTPLLYNREDVTQWGGLLASNGNRHDTLCAEATRILTAINGA
ncbi:3'(2'),5'-bisphosphate nucleotidase CysQ [Phormidium sp. CLA17]|uniref:3'(2'),5'-bisphosphate nucleotidase CysQ family protein n=1 Tax=Leptolyngbya sp. Cla-17 TaxID=2803751 RepID=UPI0014913A34|nr:3'(2'),5'-bisphosphate nucleotidase CysQ [Leptolyngbya sp. Cla-17]MBM0741240.1 3'(2'),5'-bisphosphate nucleotidase CysQ [Leptolyngbya sp. Cla-17]